jgi:hypothetical protein
MKKHQVRLTPDERAKLKTFTRTGLRSPQALLRAQLLLLADEYGEANNDVTIARTLVATQQQKLGMMTSPRNTLTRPCQTFNPCFWSVET